MSVVRVFFLLVDFIVFSVMIENMWFVSIYVIVVGNDINYVLGFEIIMREKLRDIV